MSTPPFSGSIPAHDGPPASADPLAEMLQHYCQLHTHRPWSGYRVAATHPARLTDLSEEQLAEVGALAEYDEHELVYRDARTLERISEPDQRTVQVTCADPVLAPVLPQ